VISIKFSFLLHGSLLISIIIIIIIIIAVDLIYCE
jgi:hypothetical protein